MNNRTWRNLVHMRSRYSLSPTEAKVLDLCKRRMRNREDGYNHHQIAALLRPDYEVKNSTVSKHLYTLTYRGWLESRTGYYTGKANQQVWTTLYRLPEDLKIPMSLCAECEQEFESECDYLCVECRA